MANPEVSITPNPAANQYYDPALVGPPVNPAAGVGGFGDPNVGTINRNPMLPQSPLGAYTDAQYLQENAALRNDIATRYGNIIQQLGYTDENGNYIPGSVEVNANRQLSDLQNSLRLADEDVTNQARAGGTLFSGLRGT